MNSSYKENNFDLVFRGIVFCLNPKVIVEVGILEGFSLKHMLEVAPRQCNVFAYDLFEDFPYNAADSSELKERFKDYKNLTMIKSDYRAVSSFHEDDSVDILHVDIANNGDVFEFCLENFFPKLKSGGVMILEGGSKERDRCEWMKKYEKRPMNPYLQSIKNKYNFIILDKFPSLTIIRKA